ncbi:hypothetical protein CDL12_02911 [Handroanthus impetiginosus]|uniref:RING-type domain-containing protein n=1 Tax=Handroanthus impetiginosus TaxID=429701 RepID=A0A2G9I3N0_9LAMI|nr:hypothetical protein CDL12_02911 [Handroanthus impetiginosus]
MSPTDFANAYWTILIFLSFMAWLLLAFFLVKFFMLISRHEDPDELIFRHSQSVGPISDNDSRRRQRRMSCNDEIVLDTYRQENSEEVGGGCTICLEAYKDGEIRAAIATCNHRFHAVCVKVWLVENDTCPLCRSNIV